MDLMYCESQLQVRTDEALAAGMSTLVSELHAAPTAVDRERSVREALLGTGFDWLAYGTMSRSGGRRVPTSFLTTYSHGGWTRRYFAERYYEADPRHDDLAASGVPSVWDLGDLERSASARSTPHMRRLVDDLAACGIGSGVFVQLVTAGAPDERTLISLQSSASDRRWISDSVLGRALALGLCLHDFVSRYTQRQAPTLERTTCSPLSPLQQEILHCLQRGQSDKQIAHGLQLTSHAVDYHMRQLRRRFSARNRVQLVNATL
jgi:DNA-binding CsgD family transcriptional regulator